MSRAGRAASLLLVAVIEHRLAKPAPPPLRLSGGSTGNTERQIEVVASRHMIASARAHARLRAEVENHLALGTETPVGPVLGDGQSLLAKQGDTAAEESCYSV